MFLYDLAEFKRGRKAKLTPIQKGDIAQRGYKNRITGSGYGILGHGMTIRDDFTRSKPYTILLQDAEGRGKLGRTRSVHHIRTADGKSITDLSPRLDQVGTKYGKERRTTRTYKPGRGNAIADKRKIRTISLVEDLPIAPSSTKTLPQPTQKKLPQTTNNPAPTATPTYQSPQPAKPTQSNQPKPQPQRQTSPQPKQTAKTPTPTPAKSTPKPSAKKSSKFINKYSLGALGAAGVLGGGYLGYRAYQNRKNEGKK